MNGWFGSTRRKGYLVDWIVRRLPAIAIRKELTDEWTRREYAIRTDEIRCATFGMSIEEYKKEKGTRKLRDRMNEVELLFNMLGETAAEITQAGRCTRVRGERAEREGRVLYR